MPLTISEKQKFNNKDLCDKKISLKMKKYYKKLKNQELIKVPISSDDDNDNDNDNNDNDN
jgi:hypothetical protein